MGTKSKDAEPLTKEQAQKLYAHVRAIEDMEVEKGEIAKDITERKALATAELPVQKDVLDFVLKRRKHSKGIVNNFDTMLQLVEEALGEVEEEHGEDARSRIAEAHQRHRDMADDSDGPEDDDEETGDDEGDDESELEDANVNDRADKLETVGAPKEYF